MQKIQKENMIKSIPYHNDQELDQTKYFTTPISEELEDAIQCLIYQLRELGPIKQ